MASRNAETARKVYEWFNSRDFDATANACSETVVWDDRATGATFKGRSGVREFLQGWVNAFSNAECADLQITDANDIVVTEFVGRGVNDGPLGVLPASGKQLNLRFCEILRFDQQGQIVSGTIYYDQLSMMAQLGQAESVGAAAR